MASSLMGRPSSDVCSVGYGESSNGAVNSTFLGLGEPYPELPPCAKACPRREQSLHLVAGIARVEGGLVDIVGHLQVFRGLEEVAQEKRSQITEVDG